MTGDYNTRLFASVKLTLGQMQCTNSSVLWCLKDRHLPARAPTGRLRPFRPRICALPLQVQPLGQTGQSRTPMRNRGGCPRRVDALESANVQQQPTHVSKGKRDSKATLMPRAERTTRAAQSATRFLSPMENPSSLQSSRLRSERSVALLIRSLSRTAA